MIGKHFFSVFVNNLPNDISKKKLFLLFHWTGRINDIYLVRKLKNGIVYMFAFIRYTTKGGAMKAIAEMHHTRIRGKVIYVGEAKYRRAVGGENTRVGNGDFVRSKAEIRQPEKGESSTRVEETKKITHVKED
ncbi:polyadenylate-binding protein 5-like [Arachis ipaensis]|uniref:polyadenylate-binding protein 5-like n=1 Tax=Arachis ipaensis TaxID=130454 RepID=UPI0007AFAD0F|nr:polyadenylate-binding protein 5-like [Arachis ipaensis]